MIDEFHVPVLFVTVDIIWYHVNIVDIFFYHAKIDRGATVFCFYFWSAEWVEGSVNQWRLAERTNQKESRSHFMWSHCSNLCLSFQPRCSHGGQWLCQRMAEHMVYSGSCYIQAHEHFHISEISLSKDVSIFLSFYIWSLSVRIITSVTFRMSKPLCFQKVKNWPGWAIRV